MKRRIIKLIPFVLALFCAFSAFTFPPKDFKRRKQLRFLVPSDVFARAVVKLLGRPTLSASIKIEDNINEFNPLELEDAFEGKAVLQ